MTETARHLPGARAVALGLIGGLLVTLAQARSREPFPGAKDVATTFFTLPDGRLDLNTASEAQLDLLPGVGSALAQRIVAHRLKHGPFASVEHVTDVSGIGPRTLERIRPLVVNDERRPVDR